MVIGQSHRSGLADITPLTYSHTGCHALPLITKNKKKESLRLLFLGFIFCFNELVDGSRLYTAKEG